MLRLRLDDADRRRNRLAVWRPAALLEVPTLQPAPEAPRLDRPRLAMRADLNVGVSDFVRRLEKLGRLGQRHQDVGLGRRPAIAFLVVFLGDQRIELGHAAAGPLQPGPQRLELGAVRPFELSELAHRIGGERRARVCGRRGDQRVAGSTPSLG